MAIVQKTSGHADFTNTITVAFTDPVQVGDDILVAVSGMQNNEATAMSASVSDDAGNIYLPVVSDNLLNVSFGQSAVAAIFRAKNVLAGSPNITVTVNVSPGDEGAVHFNFEAYEASGLDQRDTTNFTSGDQGSDGFGALYPVNAGDLTPAAAGDLIIVGGLSQDDEGFALLTAGSGFTLDGAPASVGVHVLFGAESQETPNASLVHCIFNDTQPNPSYWVAAAAAFKAQVPPTVAHSVDVYVDEPPITDHSHSVDAHIQATEPTHSADCLVAGIIARTVAAILPVSTRVGQQFYVTD